MNNSNKKLTNNLFKISLAIKCFESILEIIGGILLLILKQESIGNIVKLIFQHELLQDPKDFIGNLLISLSSNLSVGIQYFLAMYFLINGFVKLGLIYGLWRKKLWTYLVAEVFFSIMLIYEIYKFTSTYSIYLLLLIFIDIAVIILIWVRYKMLERKYLKEYSKNNSLRR